MTQTKTKKVDDGIPVYDIPLVKGMNLAGINSRSKRNYYVEILKKESEQYQGMINSMTVDQPTFYVRWLEKIGIGSRESRRAKRRSKMEKILDVYQKKEVWIKREIISEQAQQGYLVDDVTGEKSGIRGIIQEIEKDGFDVGILDGKPCVYEVENSDPAINSGKLRMKAYRDERRSELAVKFAEAMTDSDEGTQLTEINKYIGKIRQARMYVNNYIKILKTALRTIDKGEINRIDFSKVIYNGKNI